MREERDADVMMLVEKKLEWQVQRRQLESDLVNFVKKLKPKKVLLNSGGGGWGLKEAGGGEGKRLTLNVLWDVYWATTATVLLQRPVLNEWKIYAKAFRHHPTWLQSSISEPIFRIPTTKKQSSW